MATQCGVEQPCSDNVSAVQAGEVNCCNGDLHPTHMAAKSPAPQCPEERKKESLQSVSNAQQAAESVPGKTTEQPTQQLTGQPTENSDAIKNSTGIKCH